MIFFILLNGFVTICLLMLLIKQKSHIKELRCKEKQQAFIFYEQEQNYERLNTGKEALELFRHNIQDELLYLHDLLYSGETAKANLYITKMRGCLDGIHYALGEDTGSKAVNASWNALINDEQYEDVCATWIGKIPCHISIDNRDLVLLFSNLLHNAFEGAKEAHDKYVTVKINSKENGLFISIKNSYQQEIKKSFNGDFITSKADKENHGIGIRLIKSVIKKYEGKVEFSHTNEMFVVLIFFNGNMYKT